MSSSELDPIVISFSQTPIPTGSFWIGVLSGARRAKTVSNLLGGPLEVRNTW